MIALAAAAPPPDPGGSGGVTSVATTGGAGAGCVVVVVVVVVVEDVVITGGGGGGSPSSKLVHRKMGLLPMSLRSSSWPARASVTPIGCASLVTGCAAGAYVGGGVGRGMSARAADG